MKKIDKYRLVYAESEQEIISIVGFDKAILGIEEHSMRLIYSRKKMIKILMEENKWDEMEAIDYLNYNVFNSYIGEQTPIICTDDV